MSAIGMKDGPSHAAEHMRGFVTTERVLLQTLAQRPDDLGARRALAALYQREGWLYDAALQWRAVLQHQPSDAIASPAMQQLSSILETIDEASMNNPEDISLTVRGRVVVIALQGVASPLNGTGFDAHYEQQQAYIESMVDAGLVNVLVDMTRVTFMGSHFLRALLTWARIVRRSSGQFCLSGLRPELRKVIRLTRLTRHLRMLGGADEALRTLNQRSVGTAAAG